MSLSTDSGAAARAAAPVNGSVPGRRGGRAWLVVAALLAGLLLGVGGGMLIPRLGTPGDDSAEAGFLRDMSTHHAQAVEMSMIAHAG